MTQLAGFVRAARDGDAGELARVQVACWRRGYAALLPAHVLDELTGTAAVPEWERRWQEAITNPPTSRHKVLVAVERAAALGAGAVTGFISGGPARDTDRWPGTDGEVYELRVHPDHTGAGHGGRLLHAAVDTLVEDGFHTASTWVLAADTTLLGFLEGAGWAADGATAELHVGATLPALRLHTRISE